MIALAALVLVAFVERWAGLGFRLPYEREGDTAIVHAAAFHDLPAGASATDAAYPSTVYPLLFSRVLAVVPGSNYPQAAPIDAPLEAHLAAASEPYMRARRLIALLSLLIVPCTYLLARNWLEPWWSVFAAALSATSLLVLEVSQQAKPHGGLAGTNALALVAIFALLRKASIGAYVFAGIATGLALASLHSGWFVVPPLILAHWLGWRADRSRARWWGMSIALTICALAFVVAYPFLVFGDPLEANSGGNGLDFGEQSIPWSQWNFAGFRYMVSGMASLDPVLVVLVTAGVIALMIALASGRISRETALRPATFVMGLHVVITVALFGLHEPFYPRYFVPIVPFLCIVGTCGVRALCSAVSLPRSPSATACVALLVLALPAWVSVKHVILRLRPDTEKLAARWIESHVARDTGVIALDAALTLPLAQPTDAILEAPAWTWKPWQHYEVEVMSPDARVERWNLHTLLVPGMMGDGRIDSSEARARIAALDPKWVVVGVPAPSDAPRNETRIAVREIAGEPVARFAAEETSGPVESDPTSDIDLRHVLRLLRHVRQGPAIEIYRLR